MAIDSAIAASPIARLNGIFSVAATPGPVQAAPKPAILEQERKEEMASEGSTRFAPMPAAIGRNEQCADVEKLYIFAAFHRWVQDRVEALSQGESDAAAMQQVLVEIGGAGGFVSVLVSR